MDKLERRIGIKKFDSCEEYEAALRRVVDSSVEMAEMNPFAGLSVARSLGDFGSYEAGTAENEYNYPSPQVEDDCAIAMVACLEKYSQICTDWVPVYEQLKRADVLACTEETMRTVKHNLVIVERNLEYQKLHSTCWVCKNAAADSACEFVVKLFKQTVDKVDEVSSFGPDGKNRKEQVPHREWQTYAVKVPRCRACAERQRRQWDELSDRKWFCDSYVDIMKMSFPDGFEKRASEAKERAEKYAGLLGAAQGFSDFPEVKRLLDDGFAFGVQPEPNRWMMLGGYAESLAVPCRYSLRDVSHDGVEAVDPCD